MKHLSVVGLAFLAFAFVACSGDDSTPSPDGEGGGGGSPASGECAADGTGSIVVVVTGLPSDVAADVTIRSGTYTAMPTASETLPDLVSGPYSVTAARVAIPDPVVRAVYDPVVTASEFCLEDGGEQTVTIAYAPIFTSNQLWTSNLRSFAGADLEDSDDVEPYIVGDAPIGKDVAFDRDGNLWSMGATLAESMLVRIPAENLASSGGNDFDRTINVPEIECIPALHALAFDPEGNLWLGACGGNVLEIPAASLARSGDVSSGTVLSEVGDIEDLAFDADGNLWVASESRILRYDASRLGSSSTDPADFTITARDAEDSRGLGAVGLAFDADGDLWGFDFGSNTIFELSAADLDGSDEETIVAETSLGVGVLSLLDRGAFDESGGLWISYATNQIARLSPDQLTETRGSGDPVTPDRVVTSSELDSGLLVAFFPAPEDLPLYHTAFGP